MPNEGQAFPDSPGWLFYNAPAVREMFEGYHIPKAEVRLTPEQVGALMNGFCVVLFTGEQILFISEGVE